MKEISIAAFTLTIFVLLSGCSKESNNSQQSPSDSASPTTQVDGNKTMTAKPSISEAEFGTMPDGTKISIFTLTNSNGIEAKIINFGGVITSVKTPGKNGEFTNIVYGFDTLQPYLDGTPYFGALIGRYGNRIGNAKFELNGESYQLDVNDGNNHLHGGSIGFDKRVWTASPFSNADSVGLKLKLVSKDGDQGYPGTLTTNVTYTLNNKDELITEYSATTDKPTIVNLTQHSYFNLAGSGDILSHLLEIDADQITPVDDTLITTGELRSVEGTPFDFRTAKPIGQDIDSDNQQLQYGGGYDHNFVLNKSQPGKFEMAARLTDPSSGRVLEVWTEEPGIQFYSGNFLDGSLKSNGRTYTYRSALCLEPQHYPDSPNHDNFPSVVLNPGETYSTLMSFKFLTNK